MRNSSDLLLIVDDNILNLQLTAGILKEEGYLISLAQDGNSALVQLETIVPDLFLLDIMMPGMDGLELCRTIKSNEKFRDIPVIFLTAKNQTEDLTAGFNAGGVDYITKPFVREELVIRIKNHLELSKSRKKIIEMVNTRDKLYSVIAHDIRSPFSNIVLTLNTISEGFLDPASDDFMEIIRDLEKSANETWGLLDNLLDWTRLQNESVILSFKQNMIFPIINHSLHLLRGNIEEKKLEVITDIPETLEAFFDEISIMSVFRNIINNAIKFTPPGGKIKIEAEEKEDYARISIVDSGVGMDDSIVKRIFTHNEHYTTRGTNKEPGSGLGTFIIKDFVELNKGILEVKSEPGSGTSITVSLRLTDNK